MALFQQGTFLYDPKTDTPESVARKRQFAQAIIGNALGHAPKNVGEGLNAIGQAIIARAMDQEANAASKAGQASAAADWSPFVPQQFPPAPAAPGGGSGASASADPTGYRDAIASIESAGDGGYSAVGPTNPKLGRALGRYQIMEANIGPWSKAALGREVTPQEFLANPQLQDAIFDHRFGSYVKQFGDPALAAQAWFAGPGGVGTNRKDVLGTSVPQYAQKFAAALGDRPAAALATDAMATGQPVPPAPVQVASLDQSVGVVTPDAGSQFTPQDGQPIADDPKTQRILGTMMNPQPMGGAPMPMASQPPAQVAQAQTPGPDLSRIPVAAGGTSGAYQPDQGPSLQLLMQAASNPWLMAEPGRASIINMMLKQRMSGGQQNDFQQRASAAAQYGLDPNSADGRNFILTGKLPEQRGGAAELGLNPQYGLDKDGNPVLLQLGKDGNVVQSKLPDGVHLSKEPIKVDLGTSWGLIDPITRQVIGNVPKDLKGAAEDTEQGKLQAALRQSLPSDMMNTRQALSDIDALINNPGLDSIVGGADQYRPSWLLGDQGRDAAARLNQIKGKTFLQAYATLKGGGAITEVEGKKAEDAIGRLDRAQDEKTFRQALSDLRDVIAEGQNVMLQKAGIPQDQWGQYLNGAAGAGGGQKRLKFNPATGELE